ncbi:MAG: hypothetical protein ABLQ96_09295, partial [Candidatus Acidiferrum sp.]
EPLKLNVPYHCPDGTDNIIFSCNTNASGVQTCFWRKLRNGQIEAENFNQRPQLDAWVKVCNLAATPVAKPATAEDSANAQNAAEAVQPAPGTKQALARCIASGRSQRVCFSESMSSGFDQLSGVSLKLRSTPGLRMTGDYLSASGFRIIFQPDKAVMTCHGASTPEPYTVESSDTPTLIKIQHGPKPVVLVLRPDGKLEGSGPIRLTGISAGGTTTAQTMGTTTKTTTTQREMTPLEAQNSPDAKQNGQVYNNTETSTETSYGPTGTRNVTQYSNKTTDCSLGLMNATGPTPLAADMESPMGLLTTIASGMGTLMQGGTTDQATKKMLSTDKAPPPGLRLSGRFVGQSGFSITFHPESVSVACGAAEVAHQYTIQKSATQTLLKIQDKDNPLTLQLKSDGSLAGEGTTQVNGRVIVGTTEDPNNPYVYAPKVARCPVGTLSPAQ